MQEERRVNARRSRGGEEVDLEGTFMQPPHKAEIREALVFRVFYRTDAPFSSAYARDFGGLHPPKPNSWPDRPKETKPMKNRTVASISMILALGTAAATAEQATATKSKAHDKMGMSHDHMKVASEPHHVLAMAYHQNLAAFAKALHDQTTAADPLNLDFARAAVSEMRRSFDQMKQHHQEHMKGMSADKHAKMTGMMEKMGTRQAEMNTQITDLEQELRAATPDAKKVSDLAGRLHKHLGEMAKMHEGC